MSLTCARCDNLCLAPPSTRWRYACPRCGEILPRRLEIGPRGARTGPLHLIRKQGLRLAMLLLLLGSLTAAVRAGLTSYRAAASVRDEDAPRPSIVRINAPEKQRYDFRRRQLEQDLQRDPADFDVLLRLGQLHLQLAQWDAEKKRSHLRLARYYLERANLLTQFRWEQNWIRGLMEAANSSNPVIDVASIPGDYGPLRRDEEAWIRLRLGFLEEQVGAHPRDARLLRRLATSYVALYTVMSPGGEPRLMRPEGLGVITTDPREVRLLAAQYFRRALQCSRTHEARCRVLYGEAQLWRATDEPQQAAEALDQFLALQPNNWLVAMEAASLSRQLDRREQAERYQALSARWRLPGWI